MLKHKLKNMVGGWFIGNFDPCALQTKDFEVCYKTHKKGEQWPRHVHKIAAEITLLVRGQMMMNDKLVRPGDIITVEPGEAIKPTFITDCELVVVKTPSVPGDKYEV